MSHYGHQSSGSPLPILDRGYFSVDIDLGEMFLNFPLHRELQPVSGIDLSWFDSSLRKELPQDFKRGNIHLHWTCSWMGLKPSPYVAVAYYYLAEEFARGNPKDKKNSLHWDRVMLNLPGMEDFDPTLPEVMKWNDLARKITGDIIAFVDDLRASGYSAEHAWQVARQIASRLQFLGVQDAPRKRRPPSQDPGAWAGSILSTTGEGVYKTVSQAKWDKARDQIIELEKMMSKGSPGSLTPRKVPYKRLEQIQGFMRKYGGLVTSGMV